MTWGKSLLFGAALGIGVCLLASQAFPQVIRLASPLVRIPYTVDSVFIRYADDGSSKIDMYSTSYNDNRREISLSSSIPGNPFLTAIRRTLNATGFVLFHLRALFCANAETERAATAAIVSNGCVTGPVVGRETILDHPTVAVQFSGGDRTTLWQSPDLACFPLRVTHERRLPDGSFRLLFERRALKVTLNP